MKKLMSGFTMIELLVVIAIIGVLAAAVLSAINPVEQINKGRDTGRRSDAAEMVNAMERYFAVHEFWPWLGSCATAVAPCTYACTWGVNCGHDGVDLEYAWNGIDDTELPAGGIGGVVAGNWHWILDETDEVKSNFIERFQDNEGDLFIYKGLNEGSALTCFQPASNQFRSESFERCNAELSMVNVRDFTGGGADTLPDAAEAEICVFNGLNDPALGPNLICVP